MNESNPRVLTRLKQHKSELIKNIKNLVIDFVNLSSFTYKDHIDRKNKYRHERSTLKNWSTYTKGSY